MKEQFKVIKGKPLEDGTCVWHMKTTFKQAVAFAKRENADFVENEEGEVEWQRR